MDEKEEIKGLDFGALAKDTDMEQAIAGVRHLACMVMAYHRALMEEGLDFLNALDMAAKYQESLVRTIFGKS